MSGSANVLSVKNLLHGLGRYLNFQELLSKYNCNLSFLEYYQVSSAIPNFFFKCERGNNTACSGRLCSRGLNFSGR